MILIACVDNNFGMLFNHRRQSQDRILQKQILQMTDRQKLWMNHYSASLFDINLYKQINVDDFFLEEAGKGEYCFAEDVDVRPYEKWIEKIILYRWNRIYPADLYLPLIKHGWKIQSTVDFKGHSHDKITEEVYCK